MCRDREAPPAKDSKGNYYRGRADFQTTEMPERPMTDAELLAELFAYHPPTILTTPKFAAVNQAAKNFAEVVLQNCPPGSDRATVINCIRNARMFANAAISLNGRQLF